MWAVEKISVTTFYGNMKGKLYYFHNQTSKSEGTQSLGWHSCQEEQLLWPQGRASREQRGPT